MSVSLEELAQVNVEGTAIVCKFLSVCYQLMKRFKGGTSPEIGGITLK